MERQQQEYGLEKKEQHMQPLTDRRTTGQSWQTLLFGRQGRASRFRKKSSSLRSGIFPENLALPEAFTVWPL